MARAPCPLHCQDDFQILGGKVCCQVYAQAHVSLVVKIQATAGDKEALEFFKLLR